MAHSAEKSPRIEIATREEGHNRPVSEGMFFPVKSQEGVDYLRYEGMTETSTEMIQDHKKIVTQMSAEFQDRVQKNVPHTLKIVNLLTGLPIFLTGSVMLIGHIALDLGTAMFVPGSHLIWDSVLFTAATGLMTLGANNLLSVWRGYLPRKNYHNESSCSRYLGLGRPDSAVTYAVEHIRGFETVGIFDGIKLLTSFAVLFAAFFSHTIGFAFGNAKNKLVEVWTNDNRRPGHSTLDFLNNAFRSLQAIPGLFVGGQRGLQTYAREIREGFIRQKDKK